MIKEKGFDHEIGSHWPGVQHEGFDVDEKISLFDFAGFSL